MLTHDFRADRPAWAPRVPLDPEKRRAIHGPIRPMEEPGLLARLFGRR